MEILFKVNHKYTELTFSDSVGYFEFLFLRLTCNNYLVRLMVGLVCFANITLVSILVPLKKYEATFKPFIKYCINIQVDVYYLQTYLRDSRQIELFHLSFLDSPSQPLFVQS